MNDINKITTTTTDIKNYCDKCVALYVGMRQHSHAMHYSKMSYIASVIKDNEVLAFVNWCDTFTNQEFIDCYEDVLAQFKDIWPYIGWTGML